MLNHIYISLLCAALLFSAVLLKAQAPCMPNPHGFLHLNRSSGLLSGRVNAVIQDQQGFWWLGLESGLQRFNGKSFQTFRHQPGDSTSLPKDGVIALHADKQNRIWVASLEGICRYVPETGGFKTYKIKGKELHLGFPSRFLEDSQGDLWLASSIEKGLLRLRAGSDTWERCYLPAQTTILGRNIWEDRQTGAIWVMYKWQGKELHFGFIDRKTGQLIPGPATLNDLVRDACHFVVDQDQGLWSSRISKSWFSEYLFRYDIPTGQIQRFDVHHYTFMPLFKDNKDRVWFFDPENKEFGFIESGQNRPTVYCWPNSIDGRKALPAEIVDIFEDRESNIWIATMDGVFIFNPFAPRFLPVYAIREGNGDEKIQSPMAIWESPEGKIWIGTYGKGAFLLNHNLRLEKKIFTPIPKGYDAPANRSIFNYNTVWCFSSDREGNIWAGCQSGILMQFSPTGELLWKGQHPALDSQTVRSLAMDSDGYIWAGTQGGILARIDPQSREVARFEAMSTYSKTKTRLYQIIPDKAGWLWLVYKDQILHYHTPTKSWDLVRFSRKTEFEPGTGYELITGAVSWGKDSMLVYGRDIYWLDKKRNILGVAEKSGALPSRVMSAVRSGDDLILSFATGVVRWSPLTGKVVHYSSQDGFPDSYSDVPNNSCRLLDGRIVLGFGSEGVYVVHPDNIRSADTRPPNVHIDGIWVKGQRIPTNLYGAPKNLRLRHSENFLTVAYACPTLRQQHHLRFRYRLRGYSRDWVDNGTKRSVELTALSPGRYVLEVQVRNREGLEALQVARLPIRVLPPWYLSWPAMTIYALLLTFGIYRLYRFQLKRRIEMAQADRLREIDAFKTRFYTNITHEFRTPLTIILGMVGQAEENPEKHFGKAMEMIRRNGNRLLELVNQVLELSKLESGHLEIRLRRGDGILFLKYLTESYTSFAATRGVDLSFSSGLDALEMDFDEEKVQQVLSNLLSNAIRFTPPGGQIAVRIESLSWDLADLPGTIRKTSNSEGVLAVRVSDTGIGITAEDQKHIFDRYYQVKNALSETGTGIGLTLALELARLMGGDITVESELGKGTTFTFYLPILWKPGTAVAEAWSFQPNRNGYTPSETVVDEAVQTARGKPRILLVEDSPDVLQVLQVFLQVDYQIDTAVNGRIGLDKAIQNLPDLIISDVMMPEMDGTALCAALKQDIRTSHIPIILLTARAGLQNKLEGLDLGADEYLVKPFEKVELLARVRQLLEQRRRLQAYYLQQALSGPVIAAPETTVRASRTDEEFLQKIRSIVESRFSDANFSASDLENAMAMSHAQFYRKFKALMGINATEYLRRIRMQKAREILQDPDLSISEIAYSTGFGDPAYFTRVFKEDTGLSPNEWRR